MFYRTVRLSRTLSLIFVLAGIGLSSAADAVSCKTQSQMTPSERDALSNAARSIMGQVQSGDAKGVQAATIPAVAADFSGIAASIETLKPFVQQATITVNSLYVLDSSADQAGGGRIDFYCGSPVVILNFTDLPPGNYAFAILHATGVPKPQQIALVLSMSASNHWMLGGLFTKPMTEAGHDGLWYWVSARNFAQKKMNWDAWLYYRLAAYFINPVDFLSSPNLDKLQGEQTQVKPTDLPGTQQPLMLGRQGSVFQVTNIDTTTTFGPLDLEVQYSPDHGQATQLLDPPSARKQVTQVMTALLSLHPELHDAFHGIWVHADQGSASLFSLELPMNQIVPDGQSTEITSNPTLR